MRSPKPSLRVAEVACLECERQRLPPTIKSASVGIAEEEEVKCQIM